MPVLQGAQVQRESLSAGEVDRVREDRVVRAHLRVAEVEVAVVAREDILVEQDLLVAAVGAAPAVHRVLAAVHGSRVIRVRPVPDRCADVCLLDATHHLRRTDAHEGSRCARARSRSTHSPPRGTR